MYEVAVQQAAYYGVHGQQQQAAGTAPNSSVYQRQQSEVQDQGQGSHHPCVTPTTGMIPAPPKVPRHDAGQTSPRAPMPGGAQHPTAHITNSLQDHGLADAGPHYRVYAAQQREQQQQQAVLRKLAESANLAVAATAASAGAGISTPRQIRIPVAGADSPINSTGLTPLAAQLQLGATNGANHDQQLQHEWGYQSHQLGQGAISQLYPAQAAQQSHIWHPSQQPASHISGPFGADKPPENATYKPPIRHQSGPYADAIKALYRAQPAPQEQSAAYKSSGAAAQRTSNMAAAAAIRADPTWPFMPGLPVVEAAHYQPSTHMAPLPPPFACPPPVQPTGLLPEQPSGSLPNGTTHSYSLRSTANRGTELAGVVPSSAAVHRSRPASAPQARSESPGVGIRRGMAPAAALRTLGHVLTSYERGEVLQYREVWFAGRTGTPKIRGALVLCTPGSLSMPQRTIAQRSAH